MAAQIENFSGFETGDNSEWLINSSTGTVDATNPRPNSNGGTGGYSWKSNFGSGNDSIVLKPADNGTTLFWRAGFYTNASPGGLASVSEVFGLGAGAGALMAVRLVCNTSNQLFLRVFNQVSSAQVGSDFQINPNTWYLLEGQAVISATVGVLTLKVNGTIVVNGTGLNTGTTPTIPFYIIGATVSGTLPSGNYWMDDIAVGSVSYIGDGYCIARQGQTGTPTYDAWSKTGGATSAIVWSNTPANVSDFCSSTTSSAAQTMLVSPFSSVGSSQEGTAVIVPKDLINACKVSLSGICAIADKFSIRYRVGGVNTDMLFPFNGTTSKFYVDTLGVQNESGIHAAPTINPFVDTLTNLSTYEIGAVKGANTNTDTVYATWIQVDFTPASNPFLNIGTNYVEDWTLEY